MIHLDHCLVIFKDESIAPSWEDCTFEATYSTLQNSRSSCWCGFLVWVLVLLLDDVPRNFLYSLLGLCEVVGRRMQYFNHQIPEIESGDTAQPKINVQRNNFRFSWTVRDWRLFHAHPNWCGRMFDFQRHIRFTLKLSLSPQSRQQNLSLGIIPIDNAEPCYPHDNIA